MCSCEKGVWVVSFSHFPGDSDILLARVRTVKSTKCHVPELILVVAVQPIVCIFIMIKCIHLKNVKITMGVIHLYVLFLYYCCISYEIVLSN